MDRHTVSKYWNGGGPSPDDGRHGRPSGFDRYRDEIEEKAALPGVTAKGIHELLLERHAGDEPPVPGYNAFTSYLRGRGIAVGRGGAPDAHPRFETAPGEQLQFDWKEGVTMHDRSGRGYRFDVYTSTLGWSRMHYFVRSPTRTRDDLLACMADNIRWLGGVPRQWLTDNMSAVATLGGDGRRSRDGRVAAFAREGRLRARALPAQDAADQGQGREREPLPVAPQGLRVSRNLLVDSGMAGTCSRYARREYCPPITTSRLEQRDVSERRRDREGGVQGQGEGSQTVCGGVPARGRSSTTGGPGEARTEEEHLGSAPQSSESTTRPSTTGSSSSGGRERSPRPGPTSRRSPTSWKARQGARERERVPKKSSSLLRQGPL